MSRLSRSVSRVLAVSVLSLALVMPVGELLARGGGGRSGGFSSGRSSSFSSSRGSSSFGSSRSTSGTWGQSSSASKAPSTSSGWGSSTSTRSGAPATNADRSFASKVNQGGTTASRGQTVTLKESAAARSVPTGAQTQWNSEPASRPTYVPYGATLGDGRYAPVYYDPTYRTYGFWDSMGRWMMWDALLNSHPRNYYYDSGPGYYGGGMGYGGGYSQPYRSHSSSGFGTLMGFVFVVGLIGIGMYFYYKRASDVEMERNFAANATPTGPTSGWTPRESPSGVTVPAPNANLAAWSSFPPGSFIVLSDNQAMEDSQKRGEGFQGIRYAVESTIVAKDTEGFGTWILINLNDNHQRLMLMVKGVDNEIDYRVYYASEDFRPARREEVLKRGDLWLFQPPENENDYAPVDLQYAAEISLKTGESDITYVIKDQGERHADYTETPARGGLSDLLATIVEYSTSDSAENPELLVLEIGAASRRTGEVTLYLGSAIRESEIDVLKA